MRNSKLKKQVIQLLLLAYFSLAFLTTGTFTYRGVLMTASIIVCFFLLIGKRVTLRLQQWKPTNCLYIIFWLDFLACLVNGGEVVKRAAYAIQYTCMLFAVNTYCEEENGKEQIAKIVFWPAFAAGPIAGLVQLVQGKPIVNAMDAVFTNTIISTIRRDNPNYAALMMLLCVCLAFYLYGKKKQPLYGLCGLVSVACLGLSYSRTTLFTFAAGICWLVVWKLMRIKKEKKFVIRWRSLLAVVAIAVVVIIAMPYISGYVERYMSQADLNKLQEMKENSTLSIRVAQWGASVRAAWQGPVHNLLFGYGENAPQAIGEALGAEMSAHNLIAGSLVERGFLGAICAIALYWGLIAGVIRHSKYADVADFWILGGCVMFLVCYMMISILTWELFAMVALATAVIGECKDKEARLREPE